MLDFENEYLAKGYKYIAGVDEAGRGPLAGPVCCAAVIMPLEDIIEGVNDSKKLSEKKRSTLFDIVISKAVASSVIFVDNCVIDRVNILNATKKGMVDAINSLKIRPDIVLVDAVKLEIDVETLPIIKGDALSYSIAAASILAKVSRDALMLKYASKYPQYQFEKHKGYGTKLHYEMIENFGVCDIHRRSFLKKVLGDA